MKNILTVALIVILSAFAMAQAPTEVPAQPKIQELFFYSLDLNEPFVQNPVAVYEFGKAKLDSMRLEWEKNFGTMYLFRVVDGKNLVATLDVDFNFVLVDPKYDAVKLKSGLVLQFLNAQAQARAQAQAQQAPQTQIPQ